MKRFYKQVAVVARGEGLCIELDGRLVRTPKKAPFAVAGEAKIWSPWLTWAAKQHGAALATTIGIRHIAQDEAALAALHRAVDSHDSMELAGLNDLVTISGSLILALALSAGVLDTAAAWTAAYLDHEYQAEHWGQDCEAEADAARLRGEFEQAARFLDLYRATE